VSDGDAAAAVVVVCTAASFIVPANTVVWIVRYHHQKQFALSLLRSFYAVAVGGSSWAVERAVLGDARVKHWHAKSFSSMYL
jgi:hypothetical protein